MRDKLILIPFILSSLLFLSGCRPGPDGQEDTLEMADTSSTNAALATESLSEQSPMPPTATLEPTSTPTEVPRPTATLTPTTVAPVIRALENTNCRSGPRVNYDLLGLLAGGEEAEVKARSNVDGYWYIVNPDEPEQLCLLWDEFAELDGETADLPVFTPEPSPTPYVGFDVWFHGFEPCGSKQTAIFAIRNAGAVRIWSGYVGVYVTGPLDDLYGRVKERHPFADSPLPACPPGHGNELYPGEVRYIHAPLSNAPHDRDAYAEITLCSADHGGGDCVTKINYFYLP